MIIFLQGTYISWVSGEMVKGDTVITRSFTLSETPVWVKAGSIIPMRTDDIGPGLLNDHTCLVTCTKWGHNTHALFPTLLVYRLRYFGNSSEGSFKAKADGVHW